MIESPIVTTTCVCGGDAGAGAPVAVGEGEGVAAAAASATSALVLVGELVEAVAVHPVRVTARAARTTTVRARRGNSTRPTVRLDHTMAEPGRSDIADA
jgi:hypothetical protein